MVSDQGNHTSDSEVAAALTKTREYVDEKLYRKGFTKDEIAVALELTTWLYKGGSKPDTSKLNQIAIDQVRHLFARECLKRHLTGLPGQGEPWYADAEARARVTQARAKGQSAD